MNHVRSLGRRLGLAGVAVVVALIPMTAVPLATAQAQTTTSADLAVTMRWIGAGTPRARVGQTVNFAITATNRGPDTAVTTKLSIGTPDQLNPISLTCSDPAACGSGLDLPPGATVTATLVEQVCCFPEGAPRQATVSAFFYSQPPDPAEATPDPDTSNNTATVVVRIVGPHGFAV
jgi:uncharacterized repeat protein (TIGR01451 family)